ncbi:MAG: hypothetical protein ABR572_00155 [Cryomorphaceae bacterium]
MAYFRGVKTTDCKHLIEAESEVAKLLAEKLSLCAEPARVDAM